jgi:UDP-N-acetylmuramate-alanine ligase
MLVRDVNGGPGRRPWYHFAGVAGSGMSALAQFHALRGGMTTGSDRFFDHPKRAAGSAANGTAEPDRWHLPGDPRRDERRDPPDNERDLVDLRSRLEACGIVITPQDGTGLSGPEGLCDALIVSSAVEETVPDVRTARARGVPVLHRSELLAGFVREHRAVAITGTSGKSTVTAMTFEILVAAGLDPSVITGADLDRLRESRMPSVSGLPGLPGVPGLPGSSGMPSLLGLPGNAWAGRGDLLVIEADESDGSLVRYEPWAGVLLNLQRDHKEPEELAKIFSVFRTQTRGPFIIGEEANLDYLAEGAIRFGFGERCDLRAEEISLDGDGSHFTLRAHRAIRDPGTDAVEVRLPVPGLHNVSNATAAVAAARVCGVTLPTAALALAGFRGVARRFRLLGAVRGVEVVDDFAHNPEKIAAAIATSRLRTAPRRGRLLAFFQPHGFAPTRFLRDGLIEAFVRGLTKHDRLYLPEIFYAGGTASRDISSSDIVQAVCARGVPAIFRETRDELVGPIVADAEAGDLILVMGARDPSLTGFARAILRRLEVMR